VTDLPDQIKNPPVPIPEKPTKTLPLDDAMLQGEIFIQAHSGPLPDPETLHKYDLIKKGFAERIFNLAEKNSEHRKSMEMENMRCEKRGQWMAFTICMSAMIGSLLSVKMGQPVAGSILGGTSLVIIISAFLGKRFLGLSSKKKDD
jgi:uncharacterized membrane protein